VIPELFRPSRARRAVIGGGISLALVASLGLTTIGAAPAAFADASICVGDTCDGGKWQLARGVTNEMSYWGMSPGHNCTNYVAWRLIGDGVQRPTTNPGDAATWASRALADGVPVDRTPRVGSVAQWSSFEGGHGFYGHVAYVEQVNDDGTILISEDFYGEDQLGPLTYRTILASDVASFIHYGDHPDWLRTSSFSGEFWKPSSTGLDPQPTALTAVSLDGTSADIFYSQDGKLWQARKDALGWASADTGVRSEATSMSVVAMHGVQPYAMSIDNGVLVMTVNTASGWQRMSTGFAITGEIAAVNLGGLWPTVYLSQGGALWRIWGDHDGWHSEPTNVEVWGPISAIVNKQGWPEVFNVEVGMLFRSWLDESGWQTESTGIPASGRISAVSTETGTQVMLDQDDKLYRIVTDGESWTKWTTGVDGGAWLSAVDLGGAAPLVVQAG